MYYKRKPMSEDKAKEVAEKKDRLRKLSKMVSEMSESERLERFGGNVISCEGKSFSAFNTYFMIAQNEKCTLVGGFEQWKKQGRQVKKGETAMAIWIPAPFASKEAEVIPAGDANENKAGKRFILRNCMFDISQTEEIASVSAPSMPSMVLATV
ncbi:MAG TPA: ArdC family protein [Leptospiraceae bacterium]|nr:ArdC family protein [Leptospiraceae bacterium]